MPPRKGAKYSKEALPFATKKEYKDFLGKKIKDFTADEKTLYNRIAQAEKRKKAKAPQLEEVIEETPLAPNVADMRALLRAAGALDRTPPQQAFTPLVMSVPTYENVPSLRPKRTLGITEALNRRRERLAADESSRVADTSEGFDTEQKLYDFNVDLRLNKEQGIRSALVDALGVMGERARAKAAQKVRDDLEEIAIERGITMSPRTFKFNVDTSLSEFENRLGQEGRERARQYAEIMRGEGEAGALKTALDRFNIPSDYLLKNVKMTKSRKEAMGDAPDWYEAAEVGLDIPIPQSPRELRLDLQFGQDDPDEVFDPSPVASPLGEDDEWMDEYLREDVREAVARDKLRASGLEGTAQDPRVMRREGTYIPSTLEEVEAAG